MLYARSLSWGCLAICPTRKSEDGADVRRHVCFIGWGAGARGVRRWVCALATTGLPALVLGCRAGVGWLAVLDGKSEKLFAASLITLMLVASVLMLLGLLKSRKTAEAEQPASSER